MELLKCWECSTELPVGTHKNTRYCSKCKEDVKRKNANKSHRKRYDEGYRAPRNPDYQRPGRAPLDDGVCPICDEFGPLVRDHDNSCCKGLRWGTRCGNCERGHICRKCNSLLGLAGDSIKTLLKAIEYLESYHG